MKKFKAHIESVKNHADDEDISTEDEKVLGRVIHDLYGEVRGGQAAKTIAVQAATQPPQKKYPNCHALSFRS